MKALRNLVLVFLITVAGISVLASFYLSYWFLAHMPHVAQPEAQRTFPLNVHGTVVYLTPRESLLMDSLFWTGVASMLVLGWLRVGRG
jgi:hypothetical protein